MIAKYHYLHKLDFLSLTSGVGLKALQNNAKENIHISIPEDNIVALYIPGNSVVVLDLPTKSQRKENY